jgi:hypothetical protein
MADDFTYNLQMAGYRFDQYDERGSISYDQFVREFRSFPWASQVGTANGGSEPTIFVKNHTSNTDLWVSAAKHDDGFVYLVGITYPIEKRGFFGLGGPKQIRWVKIYVAEMAKTVEDVFHKFFSGEHDQLMRQLESLPPFAEMEAQN